MRMQIGCCCNNEPPLWVDTIRGIQCLGPLTSDTSVAGHTTDWRWDMVVGGHYNVGRHSALPQWTYFPVPTASPPIWKMRPMRYSAAISTEYYGVGPGGPTKRQASAYTPPATSDGHFSGCVVGGIVIGHSTMSANLMANIQLVKARVLVNGVDVSGVMTLSPAVAMSGNSGNWMYGWNRINGITLTLPSPVTVSSASTIWFDLWAEMRQTNVGSVIESSQLVPEVFDRFTYPAGYFSPLIAAHGSFVPYTRFGTGYGPTMTSGQINVHRRLKLADTWTLTFTGGTVGGASSLVMRPTSGWSYLRQGAFVSMTKTSGTGTGDLVQIRYDTETPEIVVRLQSQLNIEQGGAGGQFSGRMRYSVLSPSYYSPVLQSGNAIGPVTSSTPSTFTRTARGWYGASGLSWNPVELCFPSELAGFPTSISASRS